MVGALRCLQLVDNGVVVGGSLCDGCLRCCCGCRSVVEFGWMRSDIDKVFVAGGCAWVLVGSMVGALVVVVVQGTNSGGNLKDRGTGHHIVWWELDEAIGNMGPWLEFVEHKYGVSWVVVVYANFLRLLH